MSSFKSNENIHKKEDGSYYVVSANKSLISDLVMTRQRKPGEKYCNFANFKQAVDSKTDLHENGVQIIKNLSRIWGKTNHSFTLISKDQK